MVCASVRAYRQVIVWFARLYGRRTRKPYNNFTIVHSIYKGTCGPVDELVVLIANALVLAI